MIPPIRIGIATPMANPTVEPELRTLFPPEVNMLVTRSVADGDSRHRLLAYFEQLEGSLGSFGGLPLAAFGFACTASSYLLAPGLETDATARLTQAFGYPVITASQAIETALRERKVETLAIACPYPDWILEACVRFWTERGFEVVAQVTAAGQMADTRDIYSLDPAPAFEAFTKTFADVSTDAILVTGTGLPTIDGAKRLETALGISVLTSNRCLAEACLTAAATAA